MRDDDQIIRDVEKIPEQTHREGRMAIRERELGLVPFSGEPAVVGAVREARIRIMGELSAEWRRTYADLSAVVKPGLLRDLARKDAEFWFQHRDSTPEEAFLSALFELEPIEGDSPLTADARKTRYRIMRELSANREQMYAYQAAVMKPGLLRNLARKDAEFWFQHRDSTPEEALLPELREGRIAILEQELELAPLSGEPAIIASARETRCRIMRELSADWRRMYVYRSVIIKPYLLYDLKRKDAEFWFQHRDSTPKEAFLSELFELEPIEGDSPLMADARLARYRLLWDALHLRLKEEKKASATDALNRQELGRMKRMAEKKNHEAVKMTAQVLSQQSAQFWYEHMNFSADELVKLHFPNIQDWQTPSERASNIRHCFVLLTIGAAASFGAVWQFFSAGKAAEGYLCAIAMSLLAFAMFVAAFSIFSEIRRNPSGKGLYRKSQE